MAISKFERDILILKMALSPYPRSAPETSIDEVLESINRIYNNGDAKVQLDDRGYPVGDGVDDSNLDNYDPKNTVYISDLEINDKTKLATLLINRGDPTISASSFLNPETKEIRTPEPTEKETVGHSAHFIIDFNPENMTGNFYPTFLEKMPSVSRTVIRTFINKLLYNDFQKRNVTYVNAKKKDINYRPVIQIEGFLSDTLRTDLETGTLTMVEFTKKEHEFTGIDLGHKEHDVTQKIQVKIRGDEQKGGFERVKKFFGSAQQSGYDEMQIHIRGLSGNRSASPRFSTATEEAAEFLYLKVETITEFPEELGPCYSSINEHIRDKIFGLRVEKCGG
ncbi:hypothetical protein [Kiloniella majae]|uniref:hypothetical protein n=1 Tax=Kiloniella majae TaxID=1938558 RepID=UPI000A2776DD|nr:hypothetical protein [Kiloniella majae]